MREMNSSWGESECELSVEDSNLGGRLEALHVSIV